MAGVSKGSGGASLLALILAVSLGVAEEGRAQAGAGAPTAQGARQSMLGALRPMRGDAVRVPENGWRVPAEAGALGRGRMLPDAEARWHHVYRWEDGTRSLTLFLWQSVGLDARSALATAAAVRGGRFSPPVEPERTTIPTRHGPMAADIRILEAADGTPATDLLLLARSSDGWLVKIFVQHPGGREAALAEAVALADGIVLPGGVRFEAPSRDPYPPCAPVERPGALQPAAAAMTEEERFLTVMVTQMLVVVAGRVLPELRDWCTLGVAETAGFPVMILRSPPLTGNRGHSWKATVGDGVVTIGLDPAVGELRDKVGPIRTWDFSVRYPIGTVMLERLSGEADDADFRALVGRMDELWWNRREPPLLEIARPAARR